jgi:hypothetical protein
MLRTDGDPELRVFEPVIRFLHWLTLLLVVTIFVLAFSIKFASSKDEAVALIQAASLVRRDPVGRDVRSVPLAPIHAVSQLAG